MNRRCSFGDAGQEQRPERREGEAARAPDGRLFLEENSAEPFEVHPVTRSCRRIFEHGDHLLIGVSAGNSYFSAERMSTLLHWAQSRFDRIDVLYVDTHIDTMLEAQGSSPAQAAKHARSRLKDLRRRIRRAVENAAGASAAITVRSLSECTSLAGYTAVQPTIDRLLAQDTYLMQACREQVAALLGEGAGKPEDLDADSAVFKAGMAYIRAEFPFLLNTPQIVGARSSVTCYHKLMPVVEAVYRGREEATRHPQQGFIVVRPTDRNPREREMTSASGA
ncbi:tRNA-dependent cyclodipeptide synthase [Streptomyces albus]|uniref:tRNA-dependent cyclodipeptide synthase n=1 Tax=Streptomyces albus TaxID=1888 RepID=UPI0034550491